MVKRKRAKTLKETPPDAPANEEENGNFENYQLETTQELLSKLLSNPSLIRSPQLKAIRSSLYALLKSLSLSANTKLYSSQQLSHIVGESLYAGRWTDALVGLDAMRELERIPKLGSVQRWIARCPSFSDPLTGNVGKALVAGIIGITSQLSGDIDSTVDGDIAWDGWSRGATYTGDAHILEISDLLNFSVIADETDKQAGTHQRIWRQTGDFQSMLSPEFEPALIRRHSIPSLPTAFALENVLSEVECRFLIKAGEKIGYLEDSGYSFGFSGNSIDRGAAGCVWLVPNEVSSILYQRIFEHLPRTLQLALNKGSDTRAGVNCRFRFYKYTPGAIYKPHIDGAWPGSGFKGGQYEFDAFGDRKSRLTAVLYLNDDFVGGETRFFRAGLDGDLLETSVKPLTGGCLLFPHGDASPGIVHEGSAVTKGCKFIVRTDILYYDQS